MAWMKVFTILLGFGILLVSDRICDGHPQSQPIAVPVIDQKGNPVTQSEAEGPALRNTIDPLVHQSGHPFNQQPDPPLTYRSPPYQGSYADSLQHHFGRHNRKERLVVLSGHPILHQPDHPVNYRSSAYQGGYADRLKRNEINNGKIRPVNHPGHPVRQQPHRPASYSRSAYQQRFADQSKTHYETHNRKGHPVTFHPPAYQKRYAYRTKTSYENQNQTLRPDVSANATSYPAVCDKICQLSADDTPVCGNDWKTYSNRCEMRKEACKTGVAVIPVYNGPCISSLNGTVGKNRHGNRFGCININCSYHYQPVCGSDGERYSNKCHVVKRSCFSRTATIKVMDIPMELETECKFIPCPTCPEPLPISLSFCGSDGKTYSSYCHLQAAACKKRKAIIPIYAGKCA